MSKQAFKRLRRHLKLEVNRKPLPNHSEGYPLFYICPDGACLCAKCVNRNIELIDADNKMPRNQRIGWAVDAVDVHWEGDSVACDQCGDDIESAYGPIEEKEGESC
jgi:hypothetical protein